MPILVIDMDGLRWIGFVFEEGCVPPPEQIKRVWFPPAVAPRPSLHEYCPICMETTGVGDMAFEFECGHLICWECTRKWALRCPGRMTCPTCRKEVSFFGDYYSTPCHIELLEVSGFTCALATECEVPHLNFESVDIEIVRDTKSGWYPDLYKSEEARGPVEYIIQGLQAMAGYNLLIDAISRNSVQRCGCCGALHPEARCARCRRVNYCSRQCQKIHWKTHKATCLN